MTSRRRRAAATGGSAVLLALACAGPAFAAFPGLNGRIVFVSLRTSGVPQLWTLDPATPNVATQLTSKGNDADPAVSPDGTTVAFARSSSKNAGIYTVPLATTLQEASIHQVVSDATATEPSWSPDGHTLVYVSTIGGTHSIRIIDTTAASPTSSLLFSDTANDDYPVFDPADPTKIAYVRPTNGVNQIYVYNTVSATSTDISNSTSNDSKPDFSPGGNWLAFQSDRPISGSAAGTSQIWTMRADGSGSAHPLFSSPTGYTDTAPAFSPNGSLVTFVRETDDTGSDVEDTLSTPVDMVGGTPTATDANTEDLTTSLGEDFEPNWAAIPQAATNLPEVGAPALLAVAGFASFGAVALFRRRRSA